MTRRRATPPSTDTLEVWLDVNLLNHPHLVGLLSHERGHVRFRYDSAWLRHPARFMLDPDLSLDGHIFFPHPRQGNFGIFLDSSPDRWGQTLMDRREALQASDEGRRPHPLHAWDYLIGVQDLTRQGALRFRFPGTETFLDTQLRAAPPVTTLPELQAVALELTRQHIDNLDHLRRWLAVLVAPGASLGGARPKANFVDTDGSLWIGKFPSRTDTRDVAAWEMLTHTLARRAQVDVPDARLVRLGSGYHTFCVRRFDREHGARVFFASALTMTGRQQSEGASYLDLALFQTTHGAPEDLAADLAQLFRRAAFNVAVGNRDDHLRNHGFVLCHGGWRPSPAFDINPSPDQADHVLAIDEADTRPSLATALATAEFYRLTPSRARAIVDDVRRAARGWRAEARQLGISAADIQLTEAAFVAAED